MIEYILVLALAVGFYVAWNIGANDAANAIGAPIGGRLISFKKGVILLILFVLLGAVLESWRVMETVGEGIVTIPAGEYAGQNPLTIVPEIATIALFSAGFWVTLATHFKIPVSTSQSIVGSVVGAGLFLSFGTLPSGTAEKIAEVSVDLSVVLEILLAWVLTPVGAAFFAYMVYHGVDKSVRRIGSPTTLNKVFGLATIIASAFAAFSLGANTVGNATGLIYAVAGEGSGAMSLSRPLIGLFGGIAVCVGVITYGHRVVETVGEGITKLRPNTAFAAQFGAALTVWTFARLGIPVSTSEAIVGGVAGVGLVKGTAAVSKKQLGKIVLTWILTPTLAAGLTFALGWIIIGV